MHVNRTGAGFHAHNSRAREGRLTRGAADDLAITESLDSTPTLRVLVTGSRDFPRLDLIPWALREAAERAGVEHRDVTVVHGACPTGADWAADRAARELGMRPEPHRADWSRGRRAGPERNGAMVALGADLCLAFISPCTSPRCSDPGLHASHGATGCAALAENAGIRTLRWYVGLPVPD